MRGFDWKAAQGIYKINDRLVKGKLGLNENEVIMGKDLSEKLSIKIGDTIEMITPTGKTGQFLVTGFFDLQVNL
jgi:lipoprotein-releasing system permease protein